MPVTAKQVEALRVQLLGRPPEEYLRVFNELDQSDNVGYAALLAAGLFEAVQRRFVKSDKIADRSETIDFITAARAKGDDAPDAIKPDVAERMILHALGRGSISDIDDGTVLRHQIILLAALVGEAGYSEPQLDAFTARVRADAEGMLE